MRKKFHLDRPNGMIMGVCAGIADYTGWDATWVRVGLVVGTLLGGFPWTLIAYGVAAWVAKPAPRDRYFGEDIRITRTSTHELRSSMRDIDRRMAEVEEYVTSNNSRLAREIEELR
jgi:phage shock protein C